MFTVFNEQGIPVFTTNDEVEADFVAMYENGWYKINRQGDKNMVRVMITYNAIAIGITEIKTSDIATIENSGYRVKIIKQRAEALYLCCGRRCIVSP